MRTAALIAGGAAVVVAAGVATFWLVRGGFGTPRISLDRTEHDFGVVRQRMFLPAKFTVTNTGSAPLHAQAKGDCGCTTAKISSETIAPGASATIDAVFETGHLLGRQTKHLRVTSDDPQAPEVVIPLRLDIS